LGIGRQIKTPQDTKERHAMRCYTGVRRILWNDPGNRKLALDLEFKMSGSLKAVILKEPEETSEEN
jgi:hypothetical protein